MKHADYWADTISEAACECGAKLTAEQLSCIASAVEISHDNYGMAFYSPPDSDRYGDIEREWKQKLADAEKEHQIYATAAENAMKRALRLRLDDHIAIRTSGEVLRFGGRIEQVL